ncbi:MAG: pilin [Candidatus Saccharibacteria bacterium]|nr:pilin [Candidatus Saccharibacteria bacterium]
MKKIVLAVAALLMVPVMALATVAPVSAQAGGDLNLSSGLGAAKGDGQDRKLDEGAITNVINIMLYIIAILSVIMLIWGGIQYTTSGGDSNKVTSAKNTILYSIIGLVVAIFAWAIINFVLSSLGVSTP